MKHTAFVGVLALTATCVLAQTNEQDHDAHHPEGAAPAAAPSAPAPRTQGLAPEKVDQQMQMMQDMHKRMQAARTPAERQALMADHMKVMQSGMEMMSRMGQGPGGMGMGGMGAGPTSATAGNPPDPMGPGSAGGAMNGMMAMHGAMERRMAMMEQMMQMLVDRAAAGEH